MVAVVMPPPSAHTTTASVARTTHRVVLNRTSLTILGVIVGAESSREAALISPACSSEDSAPSVAVKIVPEESPADRQAAFMRGSVDGRTMGRMIATTVRTPNRVQRVMQHIASLRPVAAVFRHTFHHIDRWGLGLLRGRTLSSVLAGVPNILLTTTGAQTGRPRTVPLVGVPLDGGATALVGTRWGSEHNPGWSYNLMKEPRAVVERDGQRFDVVARRVVDGDEYAAIMRRADQVYVGFAKYRRRITRRDVPVFVLE
jgi:deazaflavin-dependent oxidoreductase (nitroreductase family)